MNNASSTASSAIPQRPSIQLDNVCLNLEGKPVLKQISLSTRAKRLGVIGRNGSGKSTLSRTLSGLIKVDSGTVSISGINPYTDRKGALREIGLLFQNPDHQIIFPTVLEEVAFGLRQLGQKRTVAEQNALDTLSEFNKTHWKDVHTSALSQGQKHLVCLMAVVAMKPNIIILDEPFAGLDIPTKKQLMRYLDAFEGTLVHISHDPQDLAGYEELLWIESGEIAAMGSLEQVLPHYLAEMHKIGDSDDISNLSD